MKQQIYTVPLWEENAPRRIMKIYEVSDVFVCGDAYDEDSFLFTAYEDAQKEYRKRVNEAKKDRCLDREHLHVTEKEDYFDFYDECDDWEHTITLSERDVVVRGALPLLIPSGRKSNHHNRSMDSPIEPLFQ